MFVKQTGFLTAKTLRMAILGVGLLSLFPMANAGNMYVFKDSKGQVLLTNVVNNGRPAGDNFQKFTQTVKVTYYPDTNVHSYSNWGSNEAAVPASGSKNKNAYDSLIVASALRHGVDPALMKAMMHTESGFNPNARLACRRSRVDATHARHCSSFWCHQCVGPCSKY